MPEQDTSNLPILDDIIVPGDADKAVPTPSSKVQSLLLAEDDREPSAVSPRTTATAVEVETQNHASTNNTSVPIAPPGDDAEGTAHTPLVAESVERPTRAADNRTNSPSLNTDVEAASVEALNIDALTKDILTSLMPAVERLLSEQIRQTLKQHLANTDLE